ncbi:MAG: hypothetical protein ACI4QA_07340 [Candidatus Spyradosoma sp.]
MSLIKYLSLSVFCASLAGCASYNTETHQKVKFISEDTPSVTVTVDGEVVGTTDCRAVISRSSNHDVLFSKPGYKSAKYSLVPFEDPDTGVVGFLDSVYVPELDPEEGVMPEPPAQPEPVAVVPPPEPVEPEPVAVVPAPESEPVADPEPVVSEPASTVEPDSGAVSAASEPAPVVEPAPESVVDVAPAPVVAPVPAPEDEEPEPVVDDPVNDTEPVDDVAPAPVDEEPEPVVDDPVNDTEPAPVVDEPETVPEEPAPAEDPAADDEPAPADDEPKADEPAPEVVPAEPAAPAEPAPVVRERTLKELKADLSELKRQRKLNLISEEEFNKRLAELSDEVSKTY